MTAEKSIKILKAVKELKDDAIYTLTDLTEAYKMAIEALSKQSASSKQVDKSVIVDFVAFQREWLNSHKTLELDAVNNALVNIFLETTGKAFIDTLGQTSENDEAIRTDDHIAEPDKMVDQFREHTKKTDSERVSPFEQEKSNSFSKEPSEDGGSEMSNSDEWWKNYIRSRMSNGDVPDTHVGKTDFKPGDKFILELGKERRMFGEFEIAGTDLYVKTDLLEKLTRYELKRRNDG